MGAPGVLKSQRSNMVVVMVMVMVVVVMVVVVVVVVLLLSWRGAGDSWCMVAGLLRFLMSCLDPLGSSCLSHRKRGP